MIVSPPRRPRRRLCSSRCCRTAGWVVVTALVCGVEHALCWCARVPVSPRPSSIDNDPKCQVGMPAFKEKDQSLALAVLLRGSDRCPTHVGSGCGLLVAGVVF